MKAIKLLYPFDSLYLARISNESVDKKLLANITKKLQPYTLVFSIPNDIELCDIALIYTYVLEDIKNDSKISNISLRALLYLTRSKQISDAIEKSRDFNDIVIISVNKQGIINVLNEMGHAINYLDEDVYECKNLNRLTDISAYRLNVLNE